MKSSRVIIGMTISFIFCQINTNYANESELQDFLFLMDPAYLQETAQWQVEAAVSSWQNQSSTEDDEKTITDTWASTLRLTNESADWGVILRAQFEW